MNTRYEKQAGLNSQLKPVNIKFNTISKSRDLSQNSGKLKTGTSVRESPNSNSARFTMPPASKGINLKKSGKFMDTLTSRKLKANAASNTAGKQKFISSDYGGVEAVKMVENG